MPKDPKYIKSTEEMLKKHKEKISKIEAALKDYESRSKSQLVSKSKELKEKYKEVENNLRKLKASTEDEFEEIKAASEDLLNELKDEFSQYSNLLTIDKLLQAKDEITEYGKEKASEIEDHVIKNPLSSAAIALVIGFVAGALIKRSK